jgi:arginine decarboxylase
VSSRLASERRTARPAPTAWCLLTHKGFRPELDIILLADQARRDDLGSGAPHPARVLRSRRAVEIHFDSFRVAERNVTPFFDNLKSLRGEAGRHLPRRRWRAASRSCRTDPRHGRMLRRQPVRGVVGDLVTRQHAQLTGNIKMRRRGAFGADRVFFVTNGTSTSNKMVHQALLEPGDIVIADRNCHKSHHYGMVLAGAQPYYVEAYPMVAYSMYGAVPIRSIKKALLDLKAAGRLDKVKTVTLTNCTFDGHVYDVRRVMEECLAIKPDLIFLWMRRVARLRPLLTALSPAHRDGARGAQGGVRRSGVSRALPRAGKAARGRSRSEGRARARHAADSRSAQGQAARLPDQLDA